MNNKIERTTKHTITIQREKGLIQEKRLFFLKNSSSFNIFLTCSKNMARNKLNQLHNIKFDLFKLQDPETGRFDVIFELEGKLLYAHKNMLNLVSDTLDSMISDRWTSKVAPIKLQDYTFDEFYQFLTFLYSGECELTDENIDAMIDIAEFYQVEPFKTFCDEYLLNLTFTTENIVQYLELADKYSLTQFNAAVQSFVSNNFSMLVNSEAVKMLKKSVVQKIVVKNKDIVKPEKLFQVVYKWAENQVLSNQENNHLLCQNDAIKSEISDFLPFIDFTKMDMNFLLGFVLPRIFVFPSLNEISKVIYGKYPTRKVTVTNRNGQMLYGYCMRDQIDIEKIKTLKFSCNESHHRFCWWEYKFQFPSTPYTLKKRDGVERYLIYFGGGEIGIIPHKDVMDGHYLLAEMSPEEGKDFVMTPDCKIEIE